MTLNSFEISLLKAYSLAPSIMGVEIVVPSRPAIATVTTSIGVLVIDRCVCVVRTVLIKRVSIIDGEAPTH